MKNEVLCYVDSEGIMRKMRGGCRLTVDKTGRFWLWSNQLQCNLAIKASSKEDALLQAVASLLFHLELKEEKIAELQEVYDLAMMIADRIKPDEHDD